MNIDVVIVGGGIAGLATGYELARCGVSFVVIERSARAGGVILSEEIDGYTIDGGPDSLLIQKPDGIRLCEEIGLADRLVSTKPPRVAFIQRDGRLHPLPAASVLGIPTRVGPFLGTRLFSWAGKLRMGAELFVPARQDAADESIGAFMTRRFGAEATAYLAEPLLAGIHAGDVDRLSIRALFPRFVEVERTHGSLLRAFRAQAQRRSVPDTHGHNGASASATEGGLAQRRSVLDAHEGDGPSASGSGGGGGAPREVKDAGAFKSLPGGLSEMVRALVKALPPGAVRLNTGASRVAGRGPFHVETTGGEALTSRAVVLATPAFVSGQLLQDRDDALGRLCGEIPYASTGTVVFAFPRRAIAHPLDGSGFVVPRVESTGILAASWLSSKWPHRAPDDRALLRAFVGGARDPGALDRSDTELAALAMSALRPLLGISGEPLFTRVYRWPRANAQHEVGHLSRMAAIEQALAHHPGLYLTGSGFRGVGIPDCVGDGRATARQVAAWIR